MPEEITYRFYGMMRGFRLRIAGVALTGILRISAGLCLVGVSKRLVDIATGNAGGQLLPWIALLLGLAFVELSFSTLGSRLAELTEASLKNGLRSRLFVPLLQSRWQSNETFHSGNLLSRLTEDVRSLSEGFSRTLPGILVSLVQATGACLFLWIFSPSLALTMLLLLPVFLLAAKVFFRRIRRYTLAIRRQESLLHEKMQESLQQRTLLLTLECVGPVMARFNHLQRSIYRHIRCRADFTNYSRTVMTAGFESGYLAAFLWGVYGLKDGSVTFGMMTAYLQLAVQIQRPVAELARQVPALVQSYAAFERLAELEDLPGETDEKTAAPETGDRLLPFTAGIRFSNVSFTYTGKGHAQIENFSHYFAPGSRTAIMGETGAGKSTLLRLILALLSPEKGNITLCGGNSCEVPVSVSTRSNLVYVPQGNTLFSGTIRSNLLLGNPLATETMMEQALQTAAADFVFSLKDGLDTRCGEHGGGLSEGQAQRIAIARGLLRPGSVLLLDEISASLDEETETLLMRRLVDNYPERTLLIITHRSRVTTYCDETIFIKAPYKRGKRL